MSAKVTVTVEVDDLKASISMSSGAGAVFTNADVYTMSGWVENSVKAMLAQDDYEGDDA